MAIAHPKIQNEPIQSRAIANQPTGSGGKKWPAVPVLRQAPPIQKKTAEEEMPMQGKFVAQKAAMPEEDPLQRAPIQRKPNNTGLPDNLKAGIENLGGYDMGDVKVHYNSPRPAQLQAHAYAQGTDIHIAPGQEKHLPHEAWHVVQQKQGRMQATVQMKGGVGVNDDAGLEREADVMGGKANVEVNNSSIQLKHLDNSNIIRCYPKSLFQLKGRFSRISKSVGGASVTTAFITSHMGDERKAIQVANNRSGQITISHTIDTSELGNILSEMNNRKTNGYYIPGNKVANPANGNLQYLTQNSYRIWESKYKTNGTLKNTKLINKRFYYDVNAGDCHHFDGIA